MAQLFILFSHGRLSPEQMQDASDSLGIAPADCIYLPADLQERYSNVPPELPSVQEWVAPIEEWLVIRSRAGDYVLIQGDFGVVVSLVHFCLEKDLRPIYSTTRRDVVAEENGKKTSIFKHIRFRPY